MMDRRIPGVYVTIEDASYVAPPVQIGRTVFNVGICQQGPHNRIVEVTSHQEFQQVFGVPDFEKTSMSHYIMDRAMQFTGRGLYVRVVPEDARVAQAIIKKAGQTFGDLVVEIAGNFTWEEGTKVIVDFDVSNNLKVGDWIFSTEEDEADYNKAKQIVGLEVNTDNTTEIELDSAYTGTVGSSSGAYKFSPFDVVYDAGYDANIALPEEPAVLDNDVVMAFYATGAGKSYNQYKIRGNRNVELEKMYTDADGNPKFKFLFMDLAVYRVKDDGDEQLVEGPWPVSLVQKTPEGAKIRDLSSGLPLFFQSVINRRSRLIRAVAGFANSELKGKTPSALALRKQITMMLSSGRPIGTNFLTPGELGIQLGSGDDGTVDGTIPLYDPNTGNIYINEAIQSRVAQVYQGTFTSVDGSIEQIKEVTYPTYLPDYILTGNWPAFVQNSGRLLADYRQDCIHLGDTGYSVSPAEDLEKRMCDYAWNNWTSALYAQFRRRRDLYTGEMMTISPVFHAIQNHLIVDRQIFLGEPVAGIENGAIAEPIRLAYQGNQTTLGDLWDAEINTTIRESDGVYFLTQFTTWKRLSILKRLHAAKFIAFCRKMIPPLLKDILQRKGTDFWVNQAEERVDNFLARFNNPDVESTYLIDSYDLSVEFDDVASELNVFINIRPIRVIERINVYITVL